MPFAKAGNRAVIHHETVFAQHHAIARAPDRQFRHGVDIDPVKKFRSVAALHVDLAQGGHVADADGFAHHACLAVAGLAPCGFARARIPCGALPQAEFDKFGAAFAGQRIRGHQAFGGKALARAMCPQRRHRNRHIGRAKGCRADIGDAAVLKRGHERQRRHVGRLALIGGHAQRGIAFQMFGCAKILAMGLRDILGGHVILEIHPGAPLALGDMPEGRAFGRAVGTMRQPDLWRVAAMLGNHGTRRRKARFQRVAGCLLACHGTGRPHARHGPVGRHKGIDVVAPDGTRANVAGQVQRGCPDPRNSKAVGAQLSPAAGGLHGDFPQPQPPPGADDLRAAQQRIVALRRCIRTCVDDSGDLDTGRLKIHRRQVARVVIGKYGHRLPGCHGKPVQIAAHRARHHHAGTIIAGEYDRLFDRAGGQDDMARIDPPEDLFGHIGRRGGQMVGHALHRAIDAPVIGAGHGGSAHQADVFHLAQLGDNAGSPFIAGLVVQMDPLGIQAASEQKILVRKDHVQTRATGHQRRDQPRRPRADHQQVAMGKALVVQPVIRLGPQFAQPGGAADKGLIHPIPKGTRPHEGLVIEPRAEKRRQQVVDRQQVEIERGKTVLRPRVQRAIQLLRGGAQVGDGVIAAPDGHQRVRLFRAGGHDAARAVILEAAPDQMPPIGQQGRGQRVAGHPQQGFAVKGKGQLAAAVDQPALGKAAHGMPPLSAARRTDRNSWVVTLRVATSQAPQPWA